MTRGAKKKPPEMRKSCYLMIPVTPRYRDAVKKVCGKLGVSVSEFARAAINAYIAMDGRAGSAWNSTREDSQPSSGRFVTVRVVGPQRFGLNNSKRYKAVVRTLDGVRVLVHSTVKHPMSSYGFQRWVDSEGKDYGQIDLVHPMFEVGRIEEISEQEAADWEESHGIF